MGHAEPRDRESDSTSWLIVFIIDLLRYLDYVLWRILGPITRVVMEIVYFFWFRLFLRSDYSRAAVERAAEKLWFVTGTVVIVLFLMYS
jgi:hypothetical protein